jgi:excisionase family DNA binding protein
MSVVEAADYLGLSPKAVRRAVKAGEIPAIPWGRTFRILRKPLDEILNARRPPKKGSQ